MKSTPATNTDQKPEQGLEAKLEAEHKAFEEQRAQLKNHYAGKYVAVLNAIVVDDDKDDESLAERMFKRFGDAPFYIGHVNDSPSVYELPSPELAH